MNDTHKNLIKSLLKMKACMSLVRGTSETGMPAVTVSVVFPKIGNVSFSLVGPDTELVK